MNSSVTRINAFQKVTLSLRSVSRRCSRLHECTPCRSIPSASPCRRQAKIEWAQIVLDRSQPGLPGSSGSASPVFGRTPNAGLESSGMVLIIRFFKNLKNLGFFGAIFQPFITMLCKIRVLSGFRSDNGMKTHARGLSDWLWTCG